MTSPRNALRHVFDGGWATDLSPRTMVSPDASGTVRVPYLTTAKNIIYELDGGLRKAPGTSKVNSAAVGSGADIHGCYDAWFHGAVGTPAQHRILNHTTVIMKDDGDGTFSNLFTGLVSGAVPSYAMIEDLLVIGLDSTDTPKSWDGTTAQALAGSPPNFSICVSHANRLWASGVKSAPSRVYYSPLLDPANTTAEGWGQINIDPSDGDKVTAMASHKGELIVFKGPYKGSIHRIAGTAPTGDDAYRRVRWIEGIGAAGQNTLFRFRDDLGFMNFDGSIHSLKATAAYGDFNEASLSRAIQTFMRRANFSRLKQAWAVSGNDCGYVLFTLPIDGATVCNAVIGMDYRFGDQPGEVRWFSWPSFDDYAMSLMSGIDPGSNNQRIYLAGGGDGFLRKLQQPSRVIDTITPISMQVRTPFFDYGAPFHTKTLGEGYLQIAPKNSGDIEFTVQRDSADVQTFEISQAAGDPLGSVSGMNFTLGVSALAESSVVERFFEADPGGEFRQVQYGFVNDIVGEDVEIHAFGLTVEGGSISTENSL
jgi:hypothetical protein